MPSSAATTLGVKVEVVSEYDPERSRPIQHQWFFRYTITITNQKSETVQLLSRHWIITDARGMSTRSAVSGSSPSNRRLSPGSPQYYILWRVAHDGSGKMEGTFPDGRAVGQLFDVKIARFSLEQTTVH